MLSGILIALALIIDQFTKYKALGLKNNSIELIGKKLQLVYVENRGAAFGFFQNKKIILLAVTIIIILALVVTLIKNYSKFSLISLISLSLIIGGAIGNLIDRIFRGYVIDFISYTFFNGYEFPVFNFADIFVVSGCILLIIAIIFTKDFEGV
ncbi:signal peptidase II [Miniphocaeibacter halophilus]|uniref:Signal peptidase II n=1 Tax=Miniphocaeibacter halophilus TaxID=2931922 RepID=A0AC61MU76_9FIRM|nr:signal peptidase II [Miniphocaeibacter halophilus]QQK07691.1 signal peptidase II [Miniphocaeibacter halophilus]